MSLYVIGMDVTKVRTSAEGPEFTVGTIGRDAETGYMYKYVKFDNGVGNVASVAGKFAYYFGSSGTTVTMDLSDSKNVGAGVFQAVIADGGYGWVQVSGIATLVVDLTAGTAGQALTPAGATDGTLDVSAAATDHICAAAIDVSVSNAPVILLTCPL